MRDILCHKGFALVFAVVIMAIAVTVGTILISLSIQNSHINSDVARYMNCYYIAHSQILHTIDIMRTNMEHKYQDHSDSNSFFYMYDNLVLADRIKPLEMKDPSFINDIEVTIKGRKETKTEYKIEVTSSTEEISRRFQAVVVVEWSNEIPLENMFRVLSIEEI